MKTNKNTELAKVEVIIYKKIKGEPFFLLLKRVPGAGGFWQPVTGSVEKDDNLAQAVVREMREETGIGKYRKMDGPFYTFKFESERGLEKEYVFGVEVPEESEVNLSFEHTKKRWCTLDEALNLLEFEENKEAFKKIYSEIKNELS